MPTKDMKQFLHEFFNPPKERQKKKKNRKYRNADDFLKKILISFLFAG